MNDIFREVWTILHFCLDIGGTGTRGALFESQGKELARAQGPGGALSLGAVQCATSILLVWHKICAMTGRRAENTAQVKITAGIAGHGLPGATAKLQEKLDGFAGLEVVGDGYGALLGATKGRPGALISVGTGVGALRLNANGTTRPVSGWGFPAGDQGSGAWLGLQLTGDLLKHLDAITLFPALCPELAKELLSIMGRKPQEIMQWHMGAKPADFASLAPLIATWADGGDAYCINLLERAAGKIARVAHALKCQEHETVFVRGGLAETLLPYCRSQTDDINWKLDGSDPVNGLFLMATGQAPKQDLLPRFGLA